MVAMAEIYKFQVSDPERQRAIDEAFARLKKYEVFDRFVDKAIDNVVPLDMAIRGFTEEYPPEPPDIAA